LEDQADTQSFLQDQLVPLLGSHADLSRALEDTEDLWAGLWSEEQRSQRTDIRGSTALVSALGVHISQLDNVLASIRNLAEATEDILSSLPTTSPPEDSP
jgi:hypothetical protein